MDTVPQEELVLILVTMFPVDRLTTLHMEQRDILLSQEAQTPWVA